LGKWTSNLEGIRGLKVSVVGTCAPVRTWGTGLGRYSGRELDDWLAGPAFSTAVVRGAFLSVDGPTHPVATQRRGSVPGEREGGLETQTTLRRNTTTFILAIFWYNS